jgi:hypothetical protein
MHSEAHIARLHVQQHHHQQLYVLTVLVTYAKQIGEHRSPRPVALLQSIVIDCCVVTVACMVWYAGGVQHHQGLADECPGSHRG